MKPWEETWLNTDRRLWPTGDITDEPLAEFYEDGLGADARAQLAAQAPAMVRLLLRLETSPSSSHEFVSALQAIKYVLRAAGVLP